MDIKTLPVALDDDQFANVPYQEVIVRGSKAPVRVWSTYASNTQTGLKRVDLDRLCADPKFIGWVQKIDPSMTVYSIRVECALFTPKGLLFAYVNAHASRSDGSPVDGVAFIRGGAVGVLVILIDKETGEKWTVLVRQNRLPVGSSDYAEIVAGMLDGHADLIGAAAGELEQETGLKISNTKLKFLHEYDSSPGGTDESITLYYAVFRLAHSRIEKIRKSKKVFGEKGENERIRLKVCLLDEILVHAGRDPKAVIAYTMYLKKNG